MLFGVSGLLLLLLLLLLQSQRSDGIRRTPKPFLVLKMMMYLHFAVDMLLENVPHHQDLNYRNNTL